VRQPLLPLLLYLLLLYLLLLQLMERMLLLPPRQPRAAAQVQEPLLLQPLPLPLRQARELAEQAAAARERGRGRRQLAWQARLRLSPASQPSSPPQRWL
jgi:hypothetical protein